MPTLTLKNIPEKLYLRLKEVAKSHRRSLNSEILYLVEQSLMPHKVELAEKIAAARKIRENNASYLLTDEEINTAKNLDRP
ncbi:MAG: Arc family DNA-binding protein [Enterobacterales bacterium]|nr:Arc family DNA-binding protein [Enterobacterales bacterium]